MMTVLYGTKLAMKLAMMIMEDQSTDYFHQSWLLYVIDVMSAFTSSTPAIQTIVMVSMTMASMAMVTMTVTRIMVQSDGV